MDLALQDALSANPRPPGRGGVASGEGPQSLTGKHPVFPPGRTWEHNPGRTRQLLGNPDRSIKMQMHLRKC